MILKKRKNVAFRIKESDGYHFIKGNGTNKDIKIMSGWELNNVHVFFPPMSEERASEGSYVIGEEMNMII